MSACRDVRSARIVDDGIKVEYTGEPDQVHELLQALLAAGVKVQSFSEQQTDLEDIFMRVTKGVVS